jgi:hypothetical protein
MTPDPYTNSGRMEDPQSWNRYAYTRGDPVNRADPRGTDDCEADICVDVWSWGDPFDGFWDSMSGPSYGYACAFGFINGCNFAQSGGSGNTQSTGGSSGNITTSNVSSEGPNEQAIDAAAQSLVAFIDPNRLSWLQSGGGNLGQYVSALLGYGLIGHGTITTTQPNSVVNAVEGPSDAPGFAIVINDNGAFFNKNVTTDIGQLQGNTIAARIFILIHEFAHSMEVPGFVPDGSSQALVNQNDQLIQKNCSKTISEFK